MAPLAVSEASVASALWAVSPEVSRCQELPVLKLNLLVLVALEALELVVLGVLVAPVVQEVPEEPVAQVPLVHSLTLSQHSVEWADSIHS